MSKKYIFISFITVGLLAAFSFVGFQAFGQETAKSLTLTSPNGGEKWKTGETYNITWNSSGIDKVNIHLQTFAQGDQPSAVIGPIATNVSASAGKYSWTIPFSMSVDLTEPASDPIGDNRQVVISDVGGTTPDRSDKQFAIVAGTTCDQKCKSAGYESGTCILFAVTPEGFAAQEQFNKTHTSIGYTSDCYLPLGLVGSRKSCYCPTEKSLTLTSPNGGETWKTEEIYDITWKSTGVDKINISLQTFANQGEPSTALGYIATNVSASAGKYSWKIPSSAFAIGDNRQILITDVNKIFSDGSDAPLSIIIGRTCSEECRKYGYQSGAWRVSCKSNEVNIGFTFGCCDPNRDQTAAADSCCCQQTTEKSLTLTSPNGGEKWKTGETYNITWNSSGVEKVKIYLGNFDSGIECVNVCGVPSGYGEVCCDPCGYQLIATDVSASPSKYSWTIPSTQAAVSKAKIAIQSTATNGCPLDYGDNYFSIAAATPINCGWCGRDCVNLTSDMAYIALAPPIGYKCLEENGKCVKKEEEIMKKVKEILIKLPDKPEVYRIVHGKRVHIPTIAAFNDLKLDWKDVVEVSSAEIVKYPLANLIKLSDDPKVYVVGKGLVRHVPNPEVFNSYNFSWGDIITVSPTELKEYGQANLIRGIGEAKVYLVENGKKRWVETAEIFTKKSYDWLKIVEINEIELKAYPTGSNIK